MDYELHPLCTLFPRIIDDEFVALTADIKTHGLREPIILHDGMILDGGNRYRACKAAGVAPNFLTFGGGNLVEYVLSSNLHRRHLSAAQRSAITAAVTDWATAQAHGGNRKADQEQIVALETVKKRAEVSNTSEYTQKKADKVAKKDPELIQAVARGEVSLDHAVEQVTKKRKPKSEVLVPDPKQQDDLREQELSLLDQRIIELEAEIERLKEVLAIGIIPEEDQEEAKALIADLKRKNETLEASLRGTEKSRDYFQNENAQMKRQISLWKNKYEKLKKETGRE